jgi:hypothetical protein
MLLIPANVEMMVLPLSTWEKSLERGSGYSDYLPKIGHGTWRYSWMSG